MANALRIVSATPVLAAVDLHQTADFYREHLGFEPIDIDPERYGILSRDGVALHFAYSASRRTPPIACRLEVRGIDALHQRCRQAGIVPANGALRTEPWRSKEFDVVDGDGNRLTLHQPVRGAAAPSRTPGRKARPRRKGAR
jgi:catechol 2,3-dioxygenase-like lactoylglutathione lyase family enzyme